jgi:hypothetical protein
VVRASIVSDFFIFYVLLVTGLFSIFAL